MQEGESKSVALGPAAALLQHCTHFLRRLTLLQQQQQQQQQTVARINLFTGPLE
jgi:hypothetical protein